MIISLEEAKKILGIIYNSKDYELNLKLKAIETMIRNKTNNSFHNRRIRVYGNLSFKDKKISGINFIEAGFRDGDQIEVNESLLNDGLYIISNITENSLIVDRDLKQEFKTCLITQIYYPDDLKLGIIKLLQYDEKMSDKIGIKQESIARVSTTYYDMNSGESIEGYPASLLNFIEKYKRLRWS